MSTHLAEAGWAVRRGGSAGGDAGKLAAAAARPAREPSKRGGSAMMTGEWASDTCLVASTRVMMSRGVCMSAQHVATCRLLQRKRVLTSD